jgi:hypothetical protein
MNGATYRNTSRFLPARRATVWVGSACLWPGQSVTVREPLPETHPAIVRGTLRRIDEPAASDPAPTDKVEVEIEGGRFDNAPTRAELWRRIKSSEGGAAAYLDATGLRFRQSTAADFADYLEDI